MSALKTLRTQSGEVLEHLEENRVCFRESEVKNIRETIHHIQNHQGTAKQWLVSAREKIHKCLHHWQPHEKKGIIIILEENENRRAQAITALLTMLQKIYITSENCREDDQLELTKRLINILLKDFLDQFVLQKDQETQSEMTVIGAESDLFIDPRPTQRYPNTKLND